MYTFLKLQRHEILIYCKDGDDSQAALKGPRSVCC